VGRLFPIEEGTLKARTWVVVGLLALAAGTIAAATGSAAPKATFTASLISDVGKFNDKSLTRISSPGSSAHRRSSG